MSYSNEKYKVLGQLAPSSNALVALYTVPSGSDAIISTISVCNTAATSSASGSFYVAIVKSGSADDIKQYLYYNMPIIANDTFMATAGFSLSNGDIVKIATSGSQSFSIFGTEIS